MTYVFPNVDPNDGDVSYEGQGNKGKTQGKGKKLTKQRILIRSCHNREYLIVGVISLFPNKTWTFFRNKSRKEKKKENPLANPIHDPV